MAEGSGRRRQAIPVVGAQPAFREASNAADKEVRRLLLERKQTSLYNPEGERADERRGMDQRIALMLGWLGDMRTAMHKAARESKSSWAKMTAAELADATAALERARRLLK